MYISLLSGVILLQLSVLVALATSSSLPAPIGASDGVPNYSEDLDEFTATTLETFGFCKLEIITHSLEVIFMVQMSLV